MLDAYHGDWVRKCVWFGAVHGELSKHGFLFQKSSFEDTCAYCLQAMLLHTVGFDRCELDWGVFAVATYFNSKKMFF